MEEKNQKGIEIEKNHHEMRSKICSFIGDETRKRGYKYGLVCLSGGLDSALTAKLANEALHSGRDDLYGLTLDFPGFNGQDLVDARVCGSLYCREHKVLDVSKLIKSYKKALPRDFDLDNPFNYLHLVQMIITNVSQVYSRQLNCAVIGSGNSTERLTGMFNIGGNVADFYPLGDLTKVQIRNLAELVEVPEHIIKKESTDGLNFGFKDEARFGLPYEKVDEVCYQLSRKQSVGTVAENCGVNEEIVREFKEQMDRSLLRLKMPICYVNPKSEEDEESTEDLVDEEASLRTQSGIAPGTSHRGFRCSWRGR